MNFNHSLRTRTKDRRSFWEVWGPFDTHFTEMNGWSVGWVRLATCLTKPLWEIQTDLGYEGKSSMCMFEWMYMLCVCGKQKFAAVDILAVAEPHFSENRMANTADRKAYTLLIHHTQHNCFAHLYHNPETSLQLQSPSGISELLGPFHTTRTSSMQLKRQCDCNSRFSWFHTNRVSSA